MGTFNRFVQVITLGLILSLTACGFLPTPPPTETPPPPTVTPTEIPPTPTTTPTPVPDGPCDNPFLPMVQGNRWLYQATGSEASYRMELSVLAVENDRATIQIVDLQNGSGPYQEVIRCRNGDLENFPMIFESLLLYQYFHRLFNTYYLTGFYVPSYSKLAEAGWSYTWQNELLSEERVRADYPELGVAVDVLENRNFTLTWQTDPTPEPLTVPAGTFFGAVRVNHHLKSLVTVFLINLSTGTPGSLEVQSTEWFQPYVGLVKAQVDQLGLTQYGTPYPVEYQMLVELIEFTPGE
jgi:hypothetical protein